MAGGFESFDTVVDVPLVARHARRSAAETRQRLDLPSDRPVALLSFGRYGLGTIDWDAVGRTPDLAVIVTHDPVDSAQRVPSAMARNVVHLDMPALARQGIRYEDVVAAADVVFTKPGYGIIAECAANDTALVYTSRGDFAEYAVLVAAMPTLLRCAYLEQDDLYAGRWMPAVRRVLNQPRVERPRCDGAQVIARHLTRYV
jgi:UDP-N-acetylglucosamine:LPS N-acetylglucosamine transferase